MKYDIGFTRFIIKIIGNRRNYVFSSYNVITFDEQVCFPLKATNVTDVPGNNGTILF